MDNKYGYFVHKPSLPSLRLARSVFVVPGRHLTTQWLLSGKLTYPPENQWLVLGRWFISFRNLFDIREFSWWFLYRITAGFQKGQHLHMMERWWVQSNWMLADRSVFFHAKIHDPILTWSNLRIDAHSEKTWCIMDFDSYTYLLIGYRLAAPWWLVQVKKLYHCTHLCAISKDVMYPRPMFRPLH